MQFFGTHAILDGKKPAGEAGFEAVFGIAGPRSEHLG
jgi:hypothetical protein